MKKKRAADSETDEDRALNQRGELSEQGIVEMQRDECREK